MARISREVIEKATELARLDRECIEISYEAPKPQSDEEFVEFLSRYAETAFWIARYMERAENLARVLDVNETFSRDSQGSQNWPSVLQLYDDGERFHEDHATASAEAVISFYTLDLKSPGSILSAVRMARENARTLRPLISTEMWIHLNIFYNKLRDLTEEDAREPRLARLCFRVSIANRQASKASARCGDAAAITTAASPISR